MLGFCGLALLDIAMNAAAGAATAHVGAQLNGAASTPLVLRMGALAGATKGAITTFHQVVAMSSVNMVFQILLMLITSSFGVCALLVTQIGNTVLGESTCRRPLLPSPAPSPLRNAPAHDRPTAAPVGGVAGCDC